MYSLYSGLYSKISMYKALCTDTHCVTALHSYTVLYSYTALHIIQLYSAIVHYTQPLQHPSGGTPTARAPAVL